MPSVAIKAQGPSPSRWANVWLTTDAEERVVAFDQAIYALGSHVDVDNVLGVAEHACRLDPGDGPRSAAALRSRLHQGADRPLRVNKCIAIFEALRRAPGAKTLTPGVPCK